MHMDSRIGVLGSGVFYAFPNGYDKPEVRGTLNEVEAALGITAPNSDERFDVVLHFQFPAWDEVGGIAYEDISARSKAEAISIARGMARSDGHTQSGKGRYWFTASPVA